MPFLPPNQQRQNTEGIPFTIPLQLIFYPALFYTHSRPYVTVIRAQSDLTMFRK